MEADTVSRAGRYRDMCCAIRAVPMPAHKDGPQQHTVLAMAGTMPYKAAVAFVPGTFAFVVVVEFVSVVFVFDSSCCLSCSCWVMMLSHCRLVVAARE